MRYHCTSLLAFSLLAGCTAPVSSDETTGQASQAVTAGPNYGQYTLSPSYNLNECVGTAYAGTGNGSTGQLWNCATNGDPHWLVAQVSSGVYEVRQAANGKCLVVQGPNFTNGTPLELWDCGGQAGSRWNLVPNGAYSVFQSIDNPSMCMDSNAWGGDGTVVQLWTCNGGTNQRYALNPSVAASISVSQTGSQYKATVTVTNSSNATASNWQVGLNMNQSAISGAATYGGVQGVTNGSVYFNNGLTILTPANAQTLGAGSSVSVSFIGNITGANWTPTIATMNGISGSFAPMLNDGIDHVARAVASGALNLLVDVESSRTTNNMQDFLFLDSHGYSVSSDGSQMVFETVGGASYLANNPARAALAVAQMDPQVASYLVTGLLSCLADVSAQRTYAFNAAVLRNWTYTTTAQNTTLGTTSGTNNINRVGSNVGGAEQIAVTETVNPSSEDKNFGLLVTVDYNTLDSYTTGEQYTKYHGANALPCSPFNGPGGTLNPYLIMSLNGGTVGARQMLPTIDCPAANNCKSVAIIDPVAYTVPGNFYDANGNLMGPQINPFALDPTAVYADPSHYMQFSTNPNGQYGTFSKAMVVFGQSIDKFTLCGLPGAGC